MEVRDGFIVGVFNYCDRWCDRCALTSHCQLFADTAQLEAELDPSFTQVTGAPPPDEITTPPPKWLREFLEEANESAGRLSDQELERLKPLVPEAHQPIVAAATKYRVRVNQWLKEPPPPSTGAAADAREVIAWFHHFIPPKVSRALTSWPDKAADDSDDPSDQDGSAKSALLGIERSHAAWLELMKAGGVTPPRGTAFITELLWIGEALEAACPRARAFVRPAFDEPEALMRFLAEGLAQ